ncbi:hypothetical protein CMV_021783 [Castanea mollissima]|uniref:Uncharacterized protein n=1 Tax=Castanea mollissima TaxID=60419 RepID=A0A8J4QJ73_9ROSI|nr:hypothetical protein CMV_021783 [Castanea mollissima]
MMSKVDANAKILGIAYLAKKFGVRSTLERLSDSCILHDNGEKITMLQQKEIESSRKTGQFSSVLAHWWNPQQL